MAKVGITELAIRDAHQSLHATRMTTADMLPICDKLDKVGYKYIEGWGGATYDSCIRFLNEDPWERLRKLHAALPNNKIMMLLRAQNLLGYKHYADDVVEKFVATAAKNGIGCFRIFDACNDPRNMECATKAAKKSGVDVQMAISYAVTPFHTNEKYAELAKTYADFGADSICIKDMSGLLKPYAAYDLVQKIKAKVDLPVEIHSHATTGLSVATLLKAAEAGADWLDTAISSMSMGTSHSPTETVVEMLKGTDMDTGLDTKLLLEIAAYFREVRKHYSSLESAFLGADTRILLSQVPGGMLSNLESQLKQQNAGDKMDAVLAELPKVHKAAGYVPLVTPTSQIVGTQAVMNVLMGPYKVMTQDFRNLITGKFGIGPFALNNNSHILTMLYGVKFKDEGFMSMLGARRLDISIDRYGNSILSWLSGLINAHVDVAKDPYISRLNVNTYTYNLVNLMIRTGFGKDTFYFTTQPIMKDLAQAYQNAASQFGSEMSGSKYRRQKEACDKIMFEFLKKNFNIPGDVTGIDKAIKVMSGYFKKVVGISMESAVKELLSKDNDILHQISKKQIPAHGKAKLWEIADGIKLSTAEVQTLVYFAKTQFEPYE